MLLTRTRLPQIRHARARVSRADIHRDGPRGAARPTRRLPLGARRARVVGRRAAGMGTVVVKRGPRRPAPEIPSGELVIEAPPEIPQASSGRWQQALMALPMVGSMLPMAYMMGTSQNSKMGYIMGGMMGLSSIRMLAMSFSQGGGGPKKAEMMAARREYLRHLASMRTRVRQTVAEQRDGLFYRHPDPQRLWSTVDSHRLWERRPTDPDFGVTRIGIGPQSLATPIIP